MLNCFLLLQLQIYTGVVLSLCRGSGLVKWFLSAEMNGVTSGSVFVLQVLYYRVTQ